MPIKYFHRRQISLSSKVTFYCQHSFISSISPIVLVITNGLFFVGGGSSNGPTSTIGVEGLISLAKEKSKHF